MMKITGAILLLTLLSGIVVYGIRTSITTKGTDLKDTQSNSTNHLEASKASYNSSKIDTSDWQVYTNKKLKFSIKYPKDWRKVENQDFVGFGPSSIGEDVIFGISFYLSSQKTEKEIINSKGTQFDNVVRKQERISINNIEATKAVAYVPPENNWYLVSIIINTNDRIIEISNGAIKDEDFYKYKGFSEGLTFEDFYRTFQFIN